jgi:DNA invertase Pin-like site-specific DNA recombinase
MRHIQLAGDDVLVVRRLDHLARQRDLLNMLAAVIARQRAAFNDRACV